MITCIDTVNIYIYIHEIIPADAFDIIVSISAIYK